LADDIKQQILKKVKRSPFFAISCDCYSEITISPSSLVDCIIDFLKGGKVSTFDNPTTTVSH
ncbi:hypothetical protein T12_10679, partial [Trichinella patagoniensis]